MLGFTLPYCDELLYSTIARHGVHSGIVSPKELLRDVFNDSKIVATSDLTGHLSCIAALYPKELGITPVDLLYKHTLFPLYVPFVGENRRKNLIHELTGSGKSAAYLTTGAAASRIKQPLYFRYCPGCMSEQMKTHGEYYWRRVWQVTGADSCPIHGRLFDTNIRLHDAHRHLFQAACSDICPPGQQQPGSWQMDLIAESVRELLNLGTMQVPELLQWGSWYRNLAIDHHFNRGSQVRHDLVWQKVVGFWGVEWLTRYGLLPDDGESCWLCSIFRKHRKAFSYLEHLIVLHAFLKPGWRLACIIRNVRCLKPVKNAPIKQLESTDKAKLSEYRNLWQAAVAKNGTREARLKGYGGIYTWLYRHDRNWLMETNERYRNTEAEQKPRIDWKKRDRNIVRELIGLRDRIEFQLDSPRRSMNWYLSQLEHKVSVEKHLDQLPLCSLFFERYSEKIFEYQIRRITCTAIRMTRNSEPLKRWQVLRWSGLSEERLTEHARRFLREILGI